ncbi:MAG: DUF3592 domain-containing protein [Planctomycetes bacterium]|nr:DUF3592 domain-containing protein [Planctomycetota bacterium]
MQPPQTAKPTNRFGVPIAFLLIFSCIWLTITTLATTLMIRGLWGQADARSRFVAVPATITSSTIKEHDGEDSTTYSNAVTYTYTHQGQNYTSDRIAFDTMSGSYRGASRWAKDHPAGATVTAYVDPQSPGTAVLRTATGRSSWMMMLFLLPFQAVGIGCLAALGSALRDRLSPPHLRHPMHGLIVKDEPHQTTFRLETVSAISSAVATTGLLAFVSIFVVAFSTGMSPPPVVAIGTAATCVGLGIIMGFWRAWRMHSGYLNVTIDRHGSMLLLPPSATSDTLDPSRPVPFNTIRQVRVRETLPFAPVSAKSDSSPPRLFSLDILVGSAPKIATVTLHKTMQEEQANRIACYLREQCGLAPEQGFPANSAESASLHAAA